MGIIMVDKLTKWTHPHYSREMNEYPDKPFELKHIYDMVQDKYVVNENHCCYYSPMSHHSECTHQKNCIFKNEDLWEIYDESIRDVLIEIRRINNVIKDLEKINDFYLNGDILYHELLDEYYIIGRMLDDDGNIKISVNVRKGFKNYIKITIKNLQMELRDLNRELFNIKRH